MNKEQELELKERIWINLLKNKRYKSYCKSGEFYIEDFSIIFDIFKKQLKNQLANPKLAGR